MGGARPRPGRRPGRSAAVREPARRAKRSRTPDCRRCRSARMWWRIIGACRCRSRRIRSPSCARGCRRAESCAPTRFAKVKSGERVTVAGLVLVRQRPGTAKGVIFMTLEDEAGVANVIVWPKAFERLRAIVLGARFVAVTGKLQSEAGRHPYRRRAHGGPDADARPAVGGGRDDRRSRARRRGPPAAADGGAKAPGQPLRPAPAARRPARAAACRSKTVDAAQAMPAGRNFH